MPVTVARFADRKSKLNTTENRLKATAFFKQRQIEKDLVAVPEKELSVIDIDGLQENDIWNISDTHVCKLNPAIARGDMATKDICAISYPDKISLFLELDESEPVGRHHNIKPKLEGSILDVLFFDNVRACKLADISLLVLRN